MSDLKELVANIDNKKWLLKVKLIALTSF